MHCIYYRRKLGSTNSYTCLYFTALASKQVNVKGTPHLVSWSKKECFIKNLNIRVKELNLQVHTQHDSLLSLANFLGLTRMISWCCWGIVRSGKGPGRELSDGELSVRGNDRSGNCPFGELSVGDVLRGDVRVENCPDTVKHSETRKELNKLNKKSTNQETIKNELESLS